MGGDGSFVALTKCQLLPPFARITETSVQVGSRKIPTTDCPQRHPEMTELVPDSLSGARSGLKRDLAVL